MLPIAPCHKACSLPIRDYLGQTTVFLALLCLRIHLVVTLSQPVKQKFQSYSFSWQWMPHLWLLSVIIRNCHSNIPNQLFELYTHLSFQILKKRLPPVTYILQQHSAGISQSKWESTFSPFSLSKVRHIFLLHGKIQWTVLIKEAWNVNADISF